MDDSHQNLGPGVKENKRAASQQQSNLLLVIRMSSAADLHIYQDPSKLIYMRNFSSLQQANEKNDISSRNDSILMRLGRMEAGGPRMVIFGQEPCDASQAEAVRGSGRRLGHELPLERVFGSEVLWQMRMQRE